MFYPEEMTAFEIMEFEYEINRQIDMARDEGQFWAVNAECQIVADLQREETLVVDGLYV
jgi:hypothetical protein